MKIGLLGYGKMGKEVEKKIKVIADAKQESDLNLIFKIQIGTYLKSMLDQKEFVNLNAEDFVEFDPKFARPSDTSLLIGDTSKAKKAFGFKPNVTFKKLVKRMVENDIAGLKKK